MSEKPCNFNKGILGHEPGAVNYEGGGDRERGHERWERKNNAEVMMKENGQERRDCEPYYCHVKFTSVCVCVCPEEPACLRPLVSDQSVWAPTDPLLGLGSKKCLRWTLNTSWRKYLHQCVSLKKTNSAAYFLLTFCSGNVIFSFISMIIKMHVLTRLRAEA